MEHTSSKTIILPLTKLATIAYRLGYRHPHSPPTVKYRILVYSSQIKRHFKLKMRTKYYIGLSGMIAASLLLSGASVEHHKIAHVHQPMTESKASEAHIPSNPSLQIKFLGIPGDTSTKETIGFKIFHEDAPEHLQLSYRVHEKHLRLSLGFRF